MDSIERRSREAPELSSPSRARTLEVKPDVQYTELPRGPERRVTDDDDNISVIAAPIILRKETRRDLNWIDVASLIINKMVGSGVFIGPFGVLRATNDKRVAIGLWVIGFLYTILSMATYLEYARDLPYTGGELVYIDELFKSRRLPLLAYSLYAAYFVTLYTTSTNALVFAQQVVMATKKVYTTASIEDDQPALRFIAITITSVICLLLYSSSAKSQLLNRITAMAKIGLLLAVIVAGIVYASKKENRHTDWTPPASTTTNWVQGLLTCLFSYHGWENATLVAGEIPHFKDLRNGFIGAVMIVSAAYITIAVTLCYAFPWSGPDQTVPTNYMALYFGNSDNAQLAAAVLTSLSAVGSMISVTYTCVRVKHCIGWSNILPWSSLWRLSSPVRIPWWRVTAILQPTPSGQRPQTFEIARGTPEGGVILSWLVTTFWICISASYHSYADAIKFTSSFLVYGHFFASAAVGYGFFMGAFEVSTYFKHDPDRRVPTPNWNSRPPWRLLFPRKHPWTGHILLGGSLFAISIVVIVCGLTYAAGRLYFYVIAGMLVLTTFYYFLWVYPPIANRMFGLLGLSVSPATHGIDDRGDTERTCDICPVYDHPEAHRHAQDGYETYNRIWVKDGSELGRFIMNIMGGSNEPRYHAPGKELGSTEHVMEGPGFERHSGVWEPASG